MRFSILRSSRPYAFLLVGLICSLLALPIALFWFLADVELATAWYVNWFSTRRLHTAIGGIPPAEYEAAYYAQNQPHPEAGPKN